jgi:hypothetical protein
VITIFQEAWQQAAYRRANEAKEPAPLPLPAQQIQAGCSQDVEFETTPLYRYRFDTQAWAEISSLPGSLISMGALPDDSGALLSVVGGSNEWQTTFWRDENGIELSSDETPVLSLGQIDPTGRYALAYAMSTQGTLSQALLADLESCEAGDCSLVPVPGMAAWSPDGRHTLITGVESLGRTSLVTNRRTYWFTLATEIWPLYRGDERAQSPGELDDLVDLGPGRAPFWLDEATYGFVRSDDSSSISPAEELVVASVADDVPQVLLTASALQAALADEEYSSAWQILAGAASPSDPDLLFLSVAAVEQQDLAQVISLDRRTAQTI